MSALNILMDSFFETQGFSKKESDFLNKYAPSGKIDASNELFEDFIEIISEAQKTVYRAGFITAREILTGNAYKNNYYRVIDDTARGIDMGISFSLVDDAAVSEVMDKPWHGKRFSKRIWDNTERLANEAQEIVGRYLVSGRSLDKAARELAEAFEVEKFHATTLVHTETAHARAMSDKKAYEDIDAEEYRYMATLDEQTCDVCGPLDGKYFKVADISEGENFPVMHPRCRCTSCIAVSFKSRRARNPLTGRNEVMSDISYDQWRQNMTPEEKAAFAEARRGYKNKRRKSIDKSQKSDIIKSRSDTVAEIVKLGKINTQPLEKEFGKILTDEIVITNERIEHIKLRHPQDYELFGKYGATTVEAPDIVIKDEKNKGTVFMVRQLENTNLNVVVRLVLSEDNENLKNSVMTFYRIRQKNLVKLERKNKVLYKKE